MSFATSKEQETKRQNDVTIVGSQSRALLDSLLPWEQPKTGTVGYETVLRPTGICMSGFSSIPPQAHPIHHYLQAVQAAMLRTDRPLAAPSTLARIGGQKPKGTGRGEIPPKEANGPHNPDPKREIRLRAGP
ncbi:unnamed protein product [Pleuronectes platessa]|uniref:Uncharacterized protein n=1 Tax=Pleuronectes platessa TaxID=8262 RepID=A0A9N7YKY1_PLEPL|nr:unnamed protein product [Pleuronectes platessa]